MSFKAFVLLLVIGACAVFAYLKMQSLGPDNSLFNQTTRISLGKHPLLRTIFSLHKDGDARGEYLSSKEHIILEIVQIPGNNLTDKVITQFREKIKQVTGRDVDVYSLDTIQNGELSENDLLGIAQVKRKHANLGQPNLFVMYTGDFRSEHAEIGRTYEEYGIVLSNDRLQALAGHNPQALEQYQLSTLMHEFGHQLGLPHNDRPDCIMYKDLEVQTAAIGYGGTYTSTDYCDIELNQLDSIRNSVN